MGVVGPPSSQNPGSAAESRTTIGKTVRLEMTYTWQIINTMVANQAISVRFLVTEKPKKIYTKSSLQGSGAPRQCMHINLTVSKSVRIRRPIVFDIVSTFLSWRALEAK